MTPRRLAPCAPAFAWRAAARMLCLGLWPAVAAAQPAAPAAPLQVRIGQVVPLSGSAAALGKDNAAGARMAVDEFNAQGLRIGGREVHLVLQVEDDAGDPRQAMQAAQRLCDLKRQGRLQAVVGHMTSGTSLPTSQVYHDCGLPHISPVATNPQLTRQGFKTTFRLLANDEVAARGLAALAAALQWKRVALVDDGSAYGRGLVDAFKARAAAEGLSIVGEHAVGAHATDFSAVLTAVKASSAQALFFGGMDAQAGPMLRQMQLLGLGGVRLLGGDGLCTTRLSELAAGVKAVEGVVCAEGGLAIDRMPGGAAWKQRFDAAHPEVFQGSAPYAYDAVRAIVWAMQQAASTAPEDWGRTMFELDRPGLIGRLQFDAQGELTEPALSFSHFVTPAEGGPPRKAALR